jgi:hypothetical protein
MMHEYFAQTPGLRDTSAWVDSFAKRIAALQQHEIPATDIERVAKTIYNLGRKSAAEQMDIDEEELLT